MNKYDQIEKVIKKYNTNFSIGVLMLSGIFLFAWGSRGLFLVLGGGVVSEVSIPWWFALLVGYSGLVLSFKTQLFTESEEENELEQTSQTWQRNENLERLRGLFEKQSEVRNDDVEELLGVSHATATRYLDELEEEGYIEQKGDVGRGVTYQKK